MTSLYLAWQDSGASRAWFPIGRLDTDPLHSRFCFSYTRGALRAAQAAGLRPLESFPDFHKRYESGELFPLFKNRVLDATRRDFSEYLQQLDLQPEKADPIAILAITGGTRQTDNLEVFPQIQRQTDGRFSCRFFLHGNRHLNEAAQAALANLRAGDELRIALEFNNPATGLALQIETTAYHIIGWTPRYLVHDLKRAMDESPHAVCVKVVRINPAPAPSNQRVLVELAGRLPDSHPPMSAPDFQLVSATDGPRNGNG